MQRSRVLLNDFARQWRDTGPDVLGAVERVGRSGWYVLGKEVEGFETSLAQHLQRSHAVGCGNGLDAIEIALRALGLPPGAPVLTTPLSAFATTLAIVRAGGRPVFVDVDASGLIDLDACEQRLASRPDVRFFVPVHLYGQSLDLDRLEALRRRFDLQVVEDCAQAIGASWRGRPVGSVGRAATLSFYPTKNLGALGDGGAITTDDAHLRDVFLSLRNYGQTTQYNHTRLGVNSRLDEVQAAILRSACLPRLSRWVERRREIARAYQSGLRHRDVAIMTTPQMEASVWHLFPVRIPSELRESFRRHLDDCGVQTGVHYPTSIPEQPALRDVAFEIEGSLSCTEALTRSVVSLPVHPYLDDEEIHRVIEAVASWTPA